MLRCGWLCCRVVLLLATLECTLLAASSMASDTTSVRRSRRGGGGEISTTTARAVVRPHVLFVMADDLGHGDLGHFNGGRTHTPAIDELIADGLTLASYYTFKICSPSRAAFHTGRYPWGMGWYDMESDGDHCTSEYELLPSLLRKQGYAPHALGKWDLGFVEARCHPTRHARGGYDSWMGYYEACLQDYWSHTFGVGTTIACQNYGANISSNLKDLSNCTGVDCIGVAEELTGVYNARAFTAEAVRIIEAHVAQAKSTSLFMYLAYHNVHLACGASYGTGLHAPCSTVLSAPNERIRDDTFKVQSAMLTELDFGVGNSSAALKRTGLWENSVLIFASDNGGPLNHGTNGPKSRGGKWTFWEGGCARKVCSLPVPGRNTGCACAARLVVVQGECRVLHQRSSATPFC